MAKHPAMTAAPKVEPRLHVSWNKDSGVKVDMDSSGMLPGATVELRVRGKITGYSMQEYGSSVEIEPKQLTITGVGEDGDRETMVEMVKARRPKSKDEEDD